MNTKKHKILIVAWSFYPYIGGMEEESYLLSKEFIKRGYQVDVLTEKRSSNSPSYEKYSGINVFRTSFVKNRNILSFIRMMVDILFFSIKYSASYDLAIIRGAFTFEPLFIGFLKFLRLFKCKTWVTADTGGEWDEIALLKKWKFSNLFIFFAKQHDSYNSICEWNTKHYLDLGFDPKKITYIKNGIDMPKMLRSKKVKVNKYIYLGRLEQIKGIKELLREFNKAIKINNTIKLTIGGDGTFEKYVHKYISTRKLNNNIFYLGRIEHKYKNKFFDKGQCLVLSSFSEGNPLVIAEALARGKMVLSTKVGDLTKEFPNILFYDIKKDGDLCNKILFYIGKIIDTNKYQKMVKYYDIKYTVDKIIKQTI